jgi:hypothetical protein
MRSTKGKTVKIMTFIHYHEPDVYGVPCEVESLWSQHFCPFCINRFFADESPTGYA